MRPCAYCGKRFRPKRHKVRFCSRGCASAGSVTPYRRRRAVELGMANSCNITKPSVIARSLCTREGPRYQRLSRLLVRHGVSHRFEYNLPGTSVIFDLAIKDQGSKYLVEFDSAYHSEDVVRVKDHKKTRVGEKLGWKVIRISCPAFAVFPPSLLKNDCALGYLFQKNGV